MRARNPASGRQTWRARALPTTMPDVAGARPRRRRAPRQRRGRAAGPAAAARCCRSPRRRPAPARAPGAGSTVPPRKRQRAGRRSGCGSASRPAGPWRRRPASARRRPASPRARRTAAPPAPSGSSRASFWNFSAAWIGLTSAKSIWNSETGTMPKAAPMAVEQRLGAPPSLGADHRAAAAGDAARRGEVPGRADRHQRRDAPRARARRARPPACRPCSSPPPAPAARPAPRAALERRQQPLGAVGVEVERRPRAGPGVPQSISSGRSPCAASQRSMRAARREVEDVGAVDQARHDQHRRPVAGRAASGAAP